MRILSVLTYYRPHTSGLTIYAERLAKALVARGHEVTMLTSQYEKHLPLEETLEGVRVKRVPVLFRVSKGVIMPTIGFHAWREVVAHDALLLHLPQFDAAGLALRGRVLNKPTILIYHSDLTLPSGLFNRLANLIVDIANDVSGRLTHRISAYTEDFATHSRFLSRFSEKIKVIPPAVELSRASGEAIAAFRREHNPDNRRPVIAMATRFAAEKGVEQLLRAMPQVFEKYPNTLVWYAGQWQDVLGEEAYLKRLLPEIEQLQAAGRWRFLGVLDLKKMAAFYPNLELLVVPSTNSTETFGFVQIEAMMNGTPVVASNLPGVRQPVAISGMGEVTPVGDVPQLAANMLKVLDKPERYRGDTDALRQMFSPEACAERHEALFEAIATELKA